LFLVKCCKIRLESLQRKCLFISDRRDHVARGDTPDRRDRIARGDTPDNLHTAFIRFAFFAVILFL
jgi:hypothetical protein